MKIIDDFPNTVREIETCWIPMSDGCRLAARIWLPEDAEKNPAPAVLEYIPYRRRDYFTRARDEPIHRYFAGYGYASLRIDMRGSGDSDGLMFDEYLKQEQDDAVDAIAWIAEQPWCSGAVGMFGKSWGGLNSLQVAARRPPALKAIITVDSTDDRYADDCHYMGGCLIDAMFEWGPMFHAILPRPPDPDIVGAAWRDMWFERMENAPQPMEEWFRHQRRDGFWKHGSVCEDYSAITTAVYCVCGWTDGYSNPVFRMLERLECPRKAMIGPWGHQYPHDGVPGPAIGWLQEAVRWWDHWLKDEPNGIMDEPILRAWMQESLRPQPQYEERPGRWVAEPAWPSPHVTARRYALNRDGLGDAAGAEERIAVSTPQTLGLSGPKWHGSALSYEQAIDQRQDDGASLCFDSAPIEERLEILGAPVAALDLTSDRAGALVAVRLNDVAPDGTSLFVSYGLLNLTHRDSHEFPEPLEPGKRYSVQVQLNEVAHAFPAGHRVRVAISNTYWHRAWPSPEVVTLGLHTGVSTLDLPVRPPRPEDVTLPTYGEPESARPMAKTVVTPCHDERTIRHDIATGMVVTTNVEDEGVYRNDDHGLEWAHRHTNTFGIRESDPLSAEYASEHTIGYARGDWSVRLVSSVRLTADRDDFRLRSTFDAWEGDTRVFSNNRDTKIPRDGM